MRVIEYISKENTKNWLEKLDAKNDVFLPVQDLQEARIGFLDYKEFKKLVQQSKESPEKRYVINHREKTALSPKYIFFPETEKLFDFEYLKDIENPEKVELRLGAAEKTESSGRIILFGLKPCDAEGISRLDRVFGEGDKKDNYYMEKRKNSLLISIGCNTPFPDCFCTLVGGSPFNFENADIGMVEVNDGYAIVKISDDAKDLISENREYFDKDIDKTAIEEEIEKIIKSSAEKIGHTWEDLPREEISKIMDESIGSGIWDQITKKCISCGACTYVCPTCYCFNIRDEQKGLQGQRYRSWDYCMNSYYTLEASGHNPRPDKSLRYRNKVNCKYNYNIKRHGHIYCVGCGRCIEVCPVSMDIREAVKTVIDNRQQASD